MDISGWIIYNGNLQGTDFIDFANMIQAAANKQQIETVIYENNDLLSYIQSNSLQLIYDKQSQLPDFIVFTDKDIYLAKHLEHMGIRLFNSAKAIETSDDKIATYQALSQQNIPIPKTIIAPKVFYDHENINLKFASKVIDTLGFPLIIKEAFGSFGEQVYLIETKDEMVNTMKKIGNKPYVFQQFISTSFGKDLRLQVVGNEVVAAMMRESKSDFRANVTAGGKMKPYDPSDEEIHLAIEATQAIHADFAGVDLLFGPNNIPIVCEVNSNAHIRNLLESTNVNVADKIITHIKNCLS